MRSSYIENDYGQVFYNVVRRFGAPVAVELGVLDGYSTYHIARALKDYGNGHLNAYDLWEDYEFKHGAMTEVKQMLEEKGVSEYVSLFKEDAYKVSENYSDRTVHLLHVDISNTGDTIATIMEQWDRKIVHGGIIFFEGGSAERDNIEWMIKYNKPPIKKALETNPIILEKYIYATYLKFPSLTMLLKKRD